MNIDYLHKKKKPALGWVEFLQIPLKHSVSRALYFLSSEWCILLKSVSYKTASKQLIFCLKNEFFDISQLLSKLSKYSSGSTLIIFGLELLRLSFFQNSSTESDKKADFGPIFPGLMAVLCATDFDNMHQSGLKPFLSIIEKIF